MAARRLSPYERHEHYIIAVASWGFAWLFSVGSPKYDPGPYSEHSTLTFRGELHRPTPFRYPKAEVELSGRAELPAPWETSPPKCLGSLDARDDWVRVYIPVSVDRLAMLTAAAPRIRLISLGGDTLFRRKALIRSLHLDTEFNPEDWSP
jgi:hypothetical protein